MLKKSDVLANNQDGISLARLTGKTVKDVVGVVDTPDGETWYFFPEYVLFGDGTQVDIYAEAGAALIDDEGAVPNLDSGTLESLAEEP